MKQSVCVCLQGGEWDKVKYWRTGKPEELHFDEWECTRGIPKLVRSHVYKIQPQTNGVAFYKFSGCR